MLDGVYRRSFITCKWSNFVSMTSRNEDSMIRNSVFSEGVGLWMFDRRTTPGCKYSQVATVMCLGCSVPGGYQAIRLVSLPLGDSMVSRTKDKKTVTQLQETWALVWLLAVQFQWWASSRCSNTFIDKVHFILIWSKKIPKIPSEMEVAQRLKLLMHCLHCWYCLYYAKIYW